MKKRIIATVLTLALFLGVLIALPTFTSAATGWDGTSSTAFSGNGTKNDPYVISSPQSLKYLQEQVTAGNNYAGKYIVLANDIDLGGKEWAPIGSRGTGKTSFSGVFDGKGFSIKGLSISVYTQYTGLFGVLAATADYNCVITNLIVEGNVVIDNDDAFTSFLMIGAIAGWTEIAGDSRVVIDNCTSNVAFNINKSTTGTEDPYVGGLVGKAQFTDFIDCRNNGAIDVKLGGDNNVIRAGGIVGANYNCTYLNCVNNGKVTALQSSAGKYLDYVGGLIGVSATAASDDTITTMVNCANLADVMAENTTEKRVRVGGLVGSYYKNNTAIENCYNSGNITGKMGESTTDYAYVGGITGHFEKEGDSKIDDKNDKNPIFTSVIIKNSYNSGIISSIGGKGDRAGGIVGVGYTITTIPNPSTVENCQTTTAKIVGYGPGTAVDCTANISTETFNTLIAPINTAIKAGSTYNFDNAISEVGTPPETTAPTTTAPTTTAPTTTAPTTTAPTTTEADDDTTVPAETTEAEQTTNTPITTKAKKRSCGSSSTSLLALLTLLGGATVFIFTKKKF